MRVLQIAAGGLVAGLLIVAFPSDMALSRSAVMMRFYF